MTIHRDGNIYFQRYEAGVPIESLKKVGKCEDTGTKISFKPDLSIFTDIIEFLISKRSTPGLVRQHFSTLD